MDLLSGGAVNTKTKTLLSLVILALIDIIIPVPLTGILLIYVLLEKPDWFRNVVSEIYDSTSM